MHTVELYDAMKSFAETLGYQVREENLGGIGGGPCEVAGRKCLFVDITLSSIERLDEVVRGIASDPMIHTANPPREIQELLELRRAA